MLFQLLNFQFKVDFSIKVLNLKRPLGSLTALKIWHDNSAPTENESSWYLKHVIVHDLQTREKTYFICEKWLAIDKEGGIEQVLSRSSDEDKTNFKYLLTSRTKQKMSDGHLWFSVFARPVQSSFSRLDRLTCCFVLLSISMVMDIMYYGMDTSSSEQDGLKIGPYINVTVEQLSVGVITNLVVFPPTFLLMQLFIRSKRRRPRLIQIKAILTQQNQAKKQTNEPKVKSNENENALKLKEKDSEEKKKKDSVYPKSRKTL